MKTKMSTKSTSLLYILKFVLCLGLITFIVVGAFFQLPANVHYHVAESYPFSGGDMDAPVYLGVMLPKSGPYQQVENIHITWDGALQKDAFNFVDAVKLSGMKRTGKDLVATIEYEVTLPQGYVSWSAPVEGFQRLPQMGIESDCECIQEKAASITDKGKLGGNAYKIYSFTAENLVYKRENIDCTGLSALSALKNGSCVCSGYARLMTALCRASDIPSQMVLGLVYPDPMFSSNITSFPQNPYEAHAWVEYYSEGSWKMADPTWGAKRLNLMQFNRNDSRHLVYGELEHVLAVDADLELWALDQAKFMLGEAHCFRYIAVSDSKQISFLPEVSIKRKWDGRWLNTLVACAVVTYLLCHFRDKILGSF
jgi:hypothetical protein